MLTPFKNVLSLSPLTVISHPWHITPNKSIPYLLPSKHFTLQEYKYLIGVTHTCTGSSFADLRFNKLNNTTRYAFLSFFFFFFFFHCKMFDPYDNIFINCPTNLPDKFYFQCLLLVLLNIFCIPKIFDVNFMIWIVCTLFWSRENLGYLSGSMFY